MSEPTLEPDELDAIREAIQQAQSPGTRPVATPDVHATPVALVSDSRAAERARPNGLKLGAKWARLCERQLARITGARISLAVEGVDSTDGATVRAETSDAWLATVRVGDHEGLVVVGGQLIEVLVARQLGDTSAELAAPTERPPSRVARRLFATVGRALLAALGEALRDELGVASAIDGAASPETWRQALGDGDVALAVRLGSTSPLGTVRLIGRPELFAGPASDRDAPAVPVAAIEAALGSVPIEVRVELGRAQLTMAELAALAPGSVITLDHTLDEPVAVACAGVVKAHGRPAMRGGSIAIEITAPDSNPERKP